MNFFEKLDISRKVLQAIIFKKRFPLLATWNITYRCNLQCKYCGVIRNYSRIEKLNSASIFNIAEKLTDAGVKFINFTGGEPLLREDLKDIVGFCKSKKIYICIKTNGILVKDKFKIVQEADRIQLSLDGPKQVNDLLRGTNVHDRVIEAIEICKTEGVKVGITTVISKYNISHIPYILDIAKKYEVEVHFQPATANLSGDSSRRILEAPDRNDYKKIISFLIKEKSKGNKFINHSIPGLKHLYYWPNPQKMNCLASLIFCAIEPDGKIFICDMFPEYQKYLLAIDGDFKQAFNKLKLPYACEQCWNSSMVEFNLMKGFNLSAALETWRRSGW